MATDLLTASDYYRLAKLYPFEAKFDGEARYITEGRRREKMRLHIAKERFADLKQESTRDGVIELRGVHGFTLENLRRYPRSLDCTTSKVCLGHSKAECTIATIGKGKVSRLAFFFYRGKSNVNVRKTSKTRFLESDTSLFYRQDDRGYAR